MHTQSLVDEQDAHADEHFDVLKGAEASANFNLMATGNWGYDSNNGKAAPNAWKTISATCGEGAKTERQSPVDLRGTTYDAMLDKTPLIFTQFDAAGSLMVSNDGHTIVVTYPGTQYSSL